MTFLGLLVAAFGLLLIYAEAEDLAVGPLLRGQVVKRS